VTRAGRCPDADGVAEAAAEERWRALAGEFVSRTIAAYEAVPGWRDGLRALGWEICRFVEEDRDRAAFLTRLTYEGGLAEARRDYLMGAYVELVHRGRLQRPAAAAVPRERAEAIVGAVWEALASRVLAGRFAELPRGVGEMMYVAVLPYLGPEAAAEELRRGPADLARYRRGEL